MRTPSLNRGGTEARPCLLGRIAGKDAGATAGAYISTVFVEMCAAGVPGVYDYAGPSGRLALTLPVHAAFRLAKGVGARIALFRSSIPRPPIPLCTLRCAPCDAQRNTRGRVDRYSFLVRLFHPPLQTGLSRRTGYPPAVGCNLKVNPLAGGGVFFAREFVRNCDLESVITKLKLRGKRQRSDE